ncbi:MAG: Spy/CpxP family protein refolding chaperone [Calothrix sp. MO_192.B10]|nr:Spy/CpxP family protein refolding chaperone [Calothrix sp. MO_192.B10]
MNWRTISASTILAASLLVPMSSIAASFNQSQTSSSYKVQTIAQNPSNDDMPFRKRKRWGNKQQRLERMQQALGLDDNQVKEIQSIHNQAKKDTQSLRQEMKVAKQEMRQLMGSNTATDEELRQQYDKIQGIRQQLSLKRFEKKLAVRKVLTPEQRAKMAELKQQRRQRWGRRGGF